MQKDKFNLPKAVAVVGPTACGKTRLGVELAVKFDGEIISADSRQIYRYLDLCTGKDKNEYIITETGRVRTGRDLSQQTIPSYLIDILEPNEEFSSAEFQQKAFKIINQILHHKKLPIVVGGSPFYVYSITEGWQFPQFKKDLTLRQKLEKMSLEELQQNLLKIDPEAYTGIDQNNPRRLQRALEICLVSGQSFASFKPKSEPKYNFLFLGKIYSNEILKKRIVQRLKERLNQGMIEEVKNIISQKKADYARLERMGLEPRYISYFLQNKINRQELEINLAKQIYQFARRQINWFKKDKRIHWVKDGQEANRLTKKFLISNSSNKSGIKR